MAWIVCMKLVRASVIDPAAVVAWATRGAALGRSDTWEGIEAAVCHVEGAQRDAADAMRAEEERHLASRGDDPNEPASAAADARLSAKVDALDRARREKKGLFANLFVGACVSLSEHRARGGDEAWYRAAIGLLLGCARSSETEYVRIRPPRPNMDPQVRAPSRRRDLGRRGRDGCRGVGRRPEGRRGCLRAAAQAAGLHPLSARPATRSYRG